MESILIELGLVIVGVSLGFIAGLLPGVGNTIMLLLSYPLILDASLFQMLLFYLSMISASQFSGSIMATVFGVPGDTSSLPAVIEGNRMFKRDAGHFAISGAAMGSVLGSVIATGVVVLVLPISLFLIKNFYNNNAQIVILLFSIFSIVLLLGKSLWQNTLMLCAGMFLAAIGENSSPRTFILLPDIIPYDIWPKLYLGLPFFPVVVALYVIPNLIKSYRETDDLYVLKNYKDNSRLIEHFKQFYNNIGSSIRGSLIGTVIGLVPHIGNHMASNISYSYEKRLGRRRKTYNKNGDAKSLVAAETANNGTSMVSLMPLILIGIPITTSEAILLTLIDSNYYLINYTTTIESGMFVHLVLWFIVINLISFTLSWPLVGYVNYIKKLSLNTIFWLTGLVLVVLVYYLGAQEMNADYYLSALLFLAPLGYFFSYLKNTEPLILIVGFVMQDKIFASIYVFYQVWLS